MKVIIAGSRDIKCYHTVYKAIQESGFKITEVVSGKASGVDTIGESWAKSNNIPVKEFPADWNNIKGENVVIKTNKFGKKYNAIAGFNRNQSMADYADALILVWKAKSPGSGDMLERAKKRNLKIFVKEI